MSLMGVASTFVTKCTFDSAINTPAKNAPVATEIPISWAITDRPNTIPKIDTISISGEAREKEEFLNRISNNIVVQIARGGLQME